MNGVASWRCIAVAFAVLLSASGAPASAQAWAPPARTGTVGVAVQRIDNNGHRTSDGTLFENGRSRNISVYVDGQYAFTDRLTVAVGLPIVFGRYTDPSPPPPFVPFLPIDQCRCWTSGAQDFAFTSRYNVRNRAFALTPSLGVRLPSHDYEYQGESVIGRRLKEVIVGIDAGQRLDMLTPRLSVSGHYDYAFVERVLDIPDNRSTAQLGASMRVAGHWTAGGDLTWIRTHGGLRLGGPPPYPLQPPGEVNTPERLREHDRLLRDNSFRAGGSVSYEFPRFDLFASYVAYLSGTDTHAGRAMTTGVSWPLDFRR